MTDWERNWRSNGVIAAVLFIVSFVFYGSQPRVGASADKLVSFYDGDSTRILIATVLFGFATLCLMWFAAALASVLRDAGKGGWANAAIAAGAAIGAVYFVRISKGNTKLHDALWQRGIAKTGGRFYTATDETAVLRAIREIDRIATGTVEAREYSARLPRFAPYALAAVSLWVVAAALRLLAPQFRTFP